MSEPTKYRLGLTEKVLAFLAIGASATLGVLTVGIVDHYRQKAALVKFKEECGIEEHWCYAVKMDEECKRNFEENKKYLEMRKRPLEEWMGDLEILTYEEALNRFDNFRWSENLPVKSGFKEKTEVPKFRYERYCVPFRGSSKGKYIVSFDPKIQGDLGKELIIDARSEYNKVFLYNSNSPSKNPNLQGWLSVMVDTESKKK